ncbi:MAG: hypothetical protein QOH01_1790 [Verrucomicrobiota bacterium]|jgi:hypothetical protein
MKHFDLNIDKILENWDAAHAFRELIANAIDEAVITGTSEPQIFLDEAGWWHIRDFGRGLRYQDLIQTENPEKLGHPSMIGKFGIGLKDALATLERKGVHVLLRSAKGDISLARVTKHEFEDLVTLHATVSAPSIPDLVGTDCAVFGISAADVDASKALFLRFAPATLLEETKFGSILQCHDYSGAIFINGMKVAHEANFLFSYNITALTAAIKKALNRERQNLGRSAYSERLRAILLASESATVAERLTDDLQAMSGGAAHEELSWIDVQEHAVRVLSHSDRRVVFLGHGQVQTRPDMIDAAQGAGFKIVSIPDNLATRIRGISDIGGAPVVEIEQFVVQHNETFAFSWVEEANLATDERAVWRHCDPILELIGGKPAAVTEIRISETMRKDLTLCRETVGLWDPANRRIIIKRSQLRSLDSFAATLLHEALHAKHMLSDISRDFEGQLTELCGKLAARLVQRSPYDPPAAQIPA